MEKSTSLLPRPSVGGGDLWLQMTGALATEKFDHIGYSIPKRKLITSQPLSFIRLILLHLVQKLSIFGNHILLLIILSCKTLETDKPEVLT